MDTREKLKQTLRDVEIKFEATETTWLGWVKQNKLKVGSILVMFFLIFIALVKLS